MPPEQDEITLAGMRFHALVGILPHERTVSQPIEIDVIARIERAEPAAGLTVDYRSLYAAASDVATGGHVDYVEQVAERVAAGVLSTRGVTGVRVRVRKPHVALAGPLEYVEISIDRPRP